MLPKSTNVYSRTRHPSSGLLCSHPLNPAQEVYTEPTSEPGRHTPIDMSYVKDRKLHS